MRRGRIITVLGFLVAVLPALGVPSQAKDIVFTVAGILIAFIGLTLRRPPRQPSLFEEDMKTHHNEDDAHDVSTGNEEKESKKYSTDPNKEV
jgi:hypothetical protein